jgi:crossover junction endodeoxyribonuclease RuvC
LTAFKSRDWYAGNRTYRKASADFHGGGNVIILGIDPGIATTGFGVLRSEGSKLLGIEFGVISSSPDQSPPERLHRIYEQVCNLFDVHHPDALATERLFFSKNEKTALGVGRTIGVVLLAAAVRGVPWVEYTPAEVKQAVVGYGAAEKQQVQYMIQRLLSLPAPPKPDDAADALAVAICHAHCAKLHALR